MKKIFLFFLLIQPFMISCAPANQTQLNYAEQRFQQRKAQCEQTVLTKKTAIAIADCVNSARIEEFSAANYQFLSNMYQLGAMNKTTAVAYAQGKITKEEYYMYLEQNFAVYVQGITNANQIA